MNEKQKEHYFFSLQENCILQLNDQNSYSLLLQQHIQGFKIDTIYYKTLQKLKPLALILKSQIFLMKSTSEISNDSSDNHLTNEHQLKCILNNSAIYMCLNQNCTSTNIFQCINEQCDCKETHINCQMGKIKPVVSMIKSKIQIATPIKQAITSKFTNIIDQLSLLEESLHKKIDSQFKEFHGQLNQSEKLFHSIFKGQKQSSSFKSQNVKNLWNVTVSQNKGIHSVLQKLKHILTSFEQQILKSIKELQEKIDMLNSLNQRQEIERKIMKESAICTTEQLSQRLAKMFSKKIKKMEYLFCASKNEFNLKKYWQICGKVPNTVILCKTNMDKIIGAYTPLIHDQEPYDKNIEDPSGESFIFSLSDNEKFTLKNKSNSIIRNSNKKAINFGEGEFYIQDKSNINICISYVNQGNYYCPSYSKGDKAACLKFNGTENSSFLSKQWEVWKVYFDE